MKFIVVISKKAKEDFEQLSPSQQIKPRRFQNSS